MVEGSGRRGLLVSKGWVQAVALVVVFGFFVLGLLAYRAYSGQPPMPERVVDPEGNVVFTGEDIEAGQGIFLRNGLMEYGSIFGHGAGSSSLGHPRRGVPGSEVRALLGILLGLDLLARHSHNRSERYRTAGFTYHHKSDAWICPEGQHLLRSGVDHERRLIRYGGKPQICNRCPAKTGCTDSDEGREVVRAVDPWPHSEAGRFHHCISLAVTLIAP